MKGKRSQLLDEVKKFPNLYNTRLESYKDSDLRERCWAEIARRLNVNTEACKREYKILRDSFRQVLRKRERAKHEHDIETSKKWRFEDKMDFLSPFMTGRESGVVKPIASDPKESLSGVDLDGMVTTEVEYLLPESDHERSDLWDPEQIDPVNEVDPMELFFSSVCQTTKRLPKRLQNRIKREVLDIVLRAEEEFDEQNNTDIKIFDNL